MELVILEYLFYRYIIALKYPSKKNFVSFLLMGINFNRLKNLLFKFFVVHIRGHFYSHSGLNGIGQVKSPDSRTTGGQKGSLNGNLGMC